MAVDVFVDTSATYNGDGTSAAQATADGGSGAYNNLQDALSAAPNAPAPGSEHHIWVRRQNISVTATLSPVNDGSYNAHHKIIGWPISVSKTAQSVDSVPTGTDSLGFSNASWQFVDAALTEAFNYWQGATVTFTSGANNGLSRMVIWFDDTTDTIYLDFPLPNDISAGDTYNIVLETEYYSQRPQSGIDAGWDSDTLVRPILDGGGGAVSLLYFSGDKYWQVFNLELRNTNSGNYYGFAYGPYKAVNCVLHNLGSPIRYLNSASTSAILQKVFVWDATYSTYGIMRDSSRVILENVHFNVGDIGSSSKCFNGCNTLQLKNCTFGRLAPFDYIFYASSAITTGRGNNVFYDANINAFTNSGIPGGNDKFTIESCNNYHNFYNRVAGGEVYDVDVDGTISPPSGATKYVKLLPFNIADIYPLIYENSRYQASGSKTYTWKFRPTGWTTLATSDIEVWASYLSESSGSYRTEVTVNPTTVTNDAWNDLSITIPADQDGIVYFEIRLKKYESVSAWIALDPKVDVV